MKLSFALSSSANSKPAAQRNSAVFWLLCLVVCYQAGYQVYISSTFLNQDPTAVDPWCSSTSGGSAQQCVEAQLFSGWQSAGRDDASDLLEPQENDLLQHHEHLKAVSTTQLLPSAATAKGDASAAQHVPPTTSAPAVTAHNGSEPKREQKVGLSSPAASPDPAMTSWAKGLIDLQEKLSERMRHVDAARAERHANLAHSTMKEWRNMSTLSHYLQALHARFDTRIAQRRADTESAKDEFKNLTDWARDVQALQKHLESEFVPHGHHAQTTPASPPRDNMTAWSRDLSALQRRMETRMEAHNKAHHALDEMDARIEAHKKAHSKPETTEEPALLEQIAALGREMCSDPKHRDGPKCAQFLAAGSAPHTTAAPPIRPSHLRGARSLSMDQAEAQLNADLHQLAEKHQAWEKSFAAKVSDTMRELCSDSVHKGQSECAQFLHDDASHSADDAAVAAAAAANRRAWHQKFASKIANVGHELCSNPLRREYAICKSIFGAKESGTNSSAEEKESSPPSVATSLQEAEGGDMGSDSPTQNLHNRMELHWSAVAEWQSRPTKGGLRGSTRHSVETSSVAALNSTDVSNLRTSAHWSGRVPSVACIALVPKGSVAKVWMKYFIDNFRLQHYEGAHQLVLVYHHTDRQAADHVHKYADGSYIKAAVARGDDYPSASAFRFGAWLARTADVVARWDFGAWHHPQRLSMQVRALAFSSRPASILKRWTVLDKTGANATMQDGEHWDNSLVGEAAWMRANWYPYMKEERAAFDAHAPRDVVSLDAPGLEVFDEAVA